MVEVHFNYARTTPCCQREAGLLRVDISGGLLRSAVRAIVTCNSRRRYRFDPPRALPEHDSAPVRERPTRIHPQSEAPGRNRALRQVMLQALHFNYVTVVNHRAVWSY